VGSRNLVYDSLIIRAKESPGGSRILTLMTAEAGLTDVFVFGGPKSRLRSLASPYASGRAFVYLDPVKDYRKLSDFEVADSFPALRDELGKLWGAGLVAELLIKTSGGGGDFPLVLELAVDCLQSLDAAAEGRYDLPLLVFCWRLVNLLGLGPDPASCAACGAEIRPGAGAAYSFQRDGFLCPACASREAMAAQYPGLGAGGPAGGPAGGGEYGAAGGGFVADMAEPVLAGGRPARLIRLGPGALRWLEDATVTGFAEAARGSLEPAVLESLKALVYGAVKRAAEVPLHSFSRGAALS
jgi:DNA repair protein RecO (recombination protein O)